ncbi:MAG TPA: hypothetical protein P5514_02035 [Bacteroidales bacterium]|nr:hypothetical protein [Bacteroidales bacterium]HRX95698.1 hypothetical protein [Bacteroidales bacterium]
MKRTSLLMILIALGMVLVISCKKDDNNNDDDNSGSTLPDAVFSMEVTGAETHTINFTLPKNVASDYGINGAHLSSQQMLTINSTDLPSTWMYGIVAQVASIKTGTYDINAGMSSFTTSAGSGYLSVSGTIKITKADLYQAVGSVDDWFIDGEFSGTYQDTNTPPNTINITGTFKGVNIKAQ